ncbi:MAG: hypothetical protein J6Y94_06120 [Bacteriovoracaceae bacterium]|nr:hypothetical protein [Bacteriovoracaceae bacterium]
MEKSTSSAEALAWDTFTTLLRGGQNHFAAQFKDEPTYPWGSKVAYLFPPSTHQTEVCGFYGIQQVDNTRLDLATRLTGLVMFKQVGPQEVANLAQEIRSVEE